jgi:cytochrome c-type biogenesis protein CcmH
MRRLTLLLALLASVAAAAAAAAPAFASDARPTLPDIEDEVMCPTCNTALNVASSPQADEQRAFIRSLIAQGKSKAEIKEALAREYGRDALAIPKGEGFNVAATVVPIGVGIGALALLVVLLPRWRRRARANPAAPAAAGPAISAADAARLDEELRRFDR